MSEAKFLQYAGDLQVYFPAVRDVTQVAVSEDE
jgi:hypothetical protein